MKLVTVPRAELLTGERCLATCSSRQCRFRTGTVRQPIVLYQLRAPPDCTWHSLDACGLLTWNLSDLDITTATMLEDPRVDYLAAAKVDVLCLQKVSGEAAPELLTDGLGRLASHLGMTGALGRATGQRLT